MYDQNQIQNGGFDHENGTYHYSYNPQYTPAPASEPQPAKKKSRRGLRIAALVLCCALVGGGAGVGGAALYGSMAEPEQAPITIYQNTTAPAAVTVKKTDGLTKMSLSEIYAAYVDSCVCVNVVSTVQQGWYQYQATGAGSGFIISEDGYIVTNYHVIDGANSIRVTLYNGETYDATLIGGEEVNDVAVIKVEGITGLKPVVLGDSDTLVVGETVSTIGNALGAYSFSMTSGIVSATGRSVTMSDGGVINMIQTNCTINSGNSGGPLFDQYGRVVGITSAKLSSSASSGTATIEGMGFAIPINDVLGIITDYMQYGYVTGRPYMGISCADITSQYQQVFGWPAGVYVNSVEDGSCAQTAGLKQGDIITKIDDTEITNRSQMISVKNSYRAGDTVQLTVYRSGEYITLSMTFDEQMNEQNAGQQAKDPEPQQTASSGSGYGGWFGGWPW